MNAEVVGVERKSPSVIEQVEGACVGCDESVISSRGKTDGVLVPMQGRWSVLMHGRCWERIRSGRAGRKVRP